MISHYDVTESVRAKAITLGAVQIGYMSDESRDLIRRKMAARDTAKAAELTRDEAYRQGICIDCRTAPHSAGRPRCNDCYQTYNDNLAKGQIR